MRSKRNSGQIYGLPVMKFTLTYDGPLPSSGSHPKNQAKWDIRKKLHPQLKDLSDNHPALLGVKAHNVFPKYGGAVLLQYHHDHPGPLIPPWAPNTSRPDVKQEWIDLCEPIEKHGKTFIPLVRNSFFLHCGLKIVFLRREEPGRVYQGGDIDGRLKTLLDGLAMPQHKEQIIDDKDAPEPLYCLMEDDALISGINVESERLLSDDNLPKDYAKLTIEVDVRVRQAMIYNQSFLG